MTHLTHLLDQRFGPETVMECVEALGEWTRCQRSAYGALEKRNSAQQTAVVPGDRFGSLTAVRPAAMGGQWWIWRCDCGVQYTRRKKDVRWRPSESCNACSGWKRSQTRRANQLKHRLERQDSEEQR